MNAESALALATFALATSITPGPNNLMLMSSGARFGLRRTLPHLLGVALGFAFMLMLVGMGVSELLQRAPLLAEAVRLACLIALLGFAWKMVATPSAAIDGEASPETAPLTFLQAAAFQWINPKAWAMALTAVAVYAPASDLLAVAAVAAVFGAVNLPSTGLWAMLGREVRGVLRGPRRRRAFDWGMAGLLLASSVPMVVAG